MASLRARMRANNCRPTQMGRRLGNAMPCNTQYCLSRLPSALLLAVRMIWRLHQPEARNDSVTTDSGRWAHSTRVPFDFLAVDTNRSRAQLWSAWTSVQI